MKKTELLEEFKMQQVCQFLSYHIDMNIIGLRFDEKNVVVTLDWPGSTPVMAGVDNILNFNDIQEKLLNFIDLL